MNRRLPLSRALGTISLGALCLSALLLSAGCAQVPTDPDQRAEYNEINDPLEPMNRKIFAVNMTLDNYLLEPVARAYRDDMPPRVQKCVHNVVGNLREPYVAGNEILQGRLSDAADDLGRFMINSTFGLGGLFDVIDPATGPKAHDSDIGVTLGVWGIGEGPYVMLPFFGPSNPRDTAGKVAEYWGDPVDATFSAYNIVWESYSRMGAATLDDRVQFLDPMDELKRNSLDLYAAIRSLYRQHRASQVGGGGSEPQDHP